MPRPPTLDPAPGEGFHTGLMSDGEGFAVDGSAGPGVLDGVASQIREMAAAFCGSSGVPGYLAGVYHGGAQAVVAHGTANAVTAAPMRTDTGFLFGSITKVFTTTLVL